MFALQLGIKHLLQFSTRTLVEKWLDFVALSEYVVEMRFECVVSLCCACLACFWVTFWCHFGTSWVPLGTLGSLLEPSWTLLGPPWEPLGVSSGFVGPSWDLPGPILRSLGELLGSFW